MKKYTLFSFVFILSLFLLGSNNVNIAKASDSGCNGAGPYSTTTGQLCSTTVTTPTECVPGDSYSYITGQPCGTTTTTTSSLVAQFNSLYKSTFVIGYVGADVQPLQQFLKDQGYYFGKIDGKYGKMTARSVSDFESDYGIITTTTTPIINTSSPTISGVSGPQSLATNQSGTWSVTASDPNSQNLSYSVNWGDNLIAYPMTSASTTTSQQSAIFTHTYTVAGTYTPTFTVTNTSGLTAQTSLSVVVGSGTTTQTIAITSPAGGEQWAQGTTHTINWTDNTPTALFITCPVSSSGITGTCTSGAHKYNIVLTDTSSVQRTIASSVSGSSYSWAIPNCTSTNPCSSNFSVPIGSYTISVCPVGGTTVCDISNSFNIISGTTPSISQVQNLTATAGGTSSVNLSWSAATATNGIGVYNIYRSTTSGFTPGSTNMIAQGNVLAYTDSGLTAGTYYYAVALRDLPGNVGPASTQASVTVSSLTTYPIANPIHSVNSFNSIF